MEKDGIILSIRHSEWISSLVMVSKKNITIHLCVDFSMMFLCGQTMTSRNMTMKSSNM